MVKVKVRVCVRLVLNNEKLMEVKCKVPAKMAFTNLCVRVCSFGTWRDAASEARNIRIPLMAALYSSPRPQSVPPGALRQRAEWSRGLCAVTVTSIACNE